MARLLTFGAEAQDRFVDGFTAATDTTVDTASSTARRGGGRAAYKVTPTAAAKGLDTGTIPGGGTSGRWYYMRVAFMLDAAVPSGRWFEIVNVRTTGNLTFTGSKIRVNDDMTLSVEGGAKSAVFAANAVHVLEVAIMGDGTNVRTIARLDGTQFEDVTNAGASLPGRYTFGQGNNSGGGFTGVGSIYLDDGAINDDTGAAENTWPATNGRVRFLAAVADAVDGANWTLGAGGSLGGVAYDSLNNLPPTGKATGSAANGDQVKNAVNSTASPASDIDLEVESFTDAGLVSGDTVAVAYAIAGHGPSTTAQILAGLRLLSNPTDSGEVTGGVVTTAVGTWPAQWTMLRGNIAYAPSPTFATRPQVRVGKRSATANALHVAIAGVMIDYTPAGGPTTQTVSPSAIGSAEAIGSATVAIGATTVRPDAIAPAAAVGSPTLTTGPVTVSPGGIGSGEAFGAAIVGNFLVIAPVGIPSSSAFGDAWVELPGLVISPEGIPPGDVGSPTVSDGGPTTIAPTGIASSEAFGASADRPLVWRAIDTTPSPPTPNPSPGRPAPRAQLVNTATAEVYDWPINHSEEQAIRLFHNAEPGARNPELGLVRRQSWGDGVSLQLSGSILDRDQHDRFEAFFAECETIGQADPNDQLLFRDPLGAEYVVVVASYDSKLSRTAQNPRHSDSQVWWRYEIELYVIEARAGALAGALY